MTQAIGDVAGRVRFARSWADTISGTSYVSLSHRELDACLRNYTDQLAEALLSEPFSTAPAGRVGADLVERHFTDSATLGRTIAHLTRLPTALNLDGTDRYRSRIARLQGAVADGYASALRRRTLAEQEGIRRAAMAAKAETEKALRASEARFRAVFAGAPIGVGVGAVDGRILDVNESLQRLLGYSAQEFTQRNVSEFIHPADAASVWRLYEELVTGQRDEFRVEKRFFRKDGEVIWTNLAVALIRDAAGQPQYQVAMFEDITERRALQTKLAHQAAHDALTDVANRATFTERLRQVFAAADDRTRVGVCFIDLDGFKAVNDTFGHGVGDTLLVQVAERLDDVTRASGGLLARLGGDEFIVLLEDTSSAEDVVAVAEALLAALDEPFDVGDHTLTVSASIGVVERRAMATRPTELLRAADVTLQASKAGGKGRWSLFSAARDARARISSALASSLSDAVAARQFQVDYQPIVELDSGAVAGAEALVRWRHPTQGLLMPEQFIQIAEKTGAIVELGRWVLAEGCREAQRWRTRGVAIPMVSVNIAVHQLVDGAFYDDVVRILDDTGLDPRCLQLELTESAVMVAPSRPVDALRALADLGVRIVVDDFGTGYSNLAYLRDLPLHGLKLASSFATGLLADDSIDEKIVAALVTLARSLELTVTAEGIETSEQAHRLYAIGCDAGQGDHFGAATSPDAIDAALRTVGAGFGTGPR
jgi:diguanylate cyclase (GGDEF)-like protein/PAS domain S-box-containing protein